MAKAQVALSLGDPKSALPLVEKAMAQQPLVATAWLLGDVRTALGDAAGAATAYARVVKDGRRGDLRTLAAYYCTKDLEHDEALKVIEAERRNRGGVYTDDVYAWALYRGGRFTEARAAMGDGPGLAPREGDACGAACAGRPEA